MANRQLQQFCSPMSFENAVYLWMLEKDVFCIHGSNLLGIPQSTHRVATAAFRRTFHHDGKISQGRWGLEVHAHPLSLYLPSRSKLQCMLQLKAQIHSLYFNSTLYGLCRIYYTIRKLCVQFEVQYMYNKNSICQIRNETRTHWKQKIDYWPLFIESSQQRQ
jgi:hypothetical protein